MYHEQELVSIRKLTKGIEGLSLERLFHLTNGVPAQDELGQAAVTRMPTDLHLSMGHFLHDLLERILQPDSLPQFVSELGSGLGYGISISQFLDS
ncbi:hypothetical protein N7507_010175 [Penicillium longicatenatum]|nr:hypothetical protein N7507_010175 [Penicillium longicatenatum]